MVDHRLVSSTDHGKSLQPDDDIGELHIRTNMLSFSQSDTVVSYANTGTDNGISKYLYASANDGHSWTKRMPTGITIASIHSVVASPLDVGTVYVTNSGPIADGSGVVYVSRDGGESFTWDSEGMNSGYSSFFTTNQYDFSGAGAQLAIDRSGTEEETVEAVFLKKNSIISYRLQYLGELRYEAYLQWLRPKKNVLHGFSKCTIRFTF
jgi:hypothetical protein